MPKRNRNKGGKNPSNKRSKWNNEPLATHSLGFRQYYQAQSPLFADDWSNFEKTLQKPLSTVFRINAALPTSISNNIKQRLRTEFQEIFNKEQQEQQQKEAPPSTSSSSSSSSFSFPNSATIITPPIPISWYPGIDNCWQVGTHIKKIRKNPQFKTFHEFVVQSNERGIIARQEAVSMIPAFLLGVRPHHRVLDMCAAPGSKTLQLAEMLCTTNNTDNTDNTDNTSDSGGFLVANDSNIKRTYTLINRVTMLNVPSFVVTNHDAQMFPSIKSKTYPKGLTFDRILCDVPCSGDGTLRKAPDLWGRWRVTLGHGLHRIQKKIALRACDLLREAKAGEESSYMVYSTCSFNPIENEAVVAEILRQRKDMELIDASHLLPNLIRRPGLSHWKVAIQLNHTSKQDSKDLKDIKGWRGKGTDQTEQTKTTEQTETTETTKGKKEDEDVEMSVSSDKKGKRNKFTNTKMCRLHQKGECKFGDTCKFSHVDLPIQNAAADGDDATTPKIDMSTFFKFTDQCRDGDKSLFPPTAEEVKTMHLERCLRLMPQDQDTGGFFVALLCKKSISKVDTAPKLKKETETNASSSTTTATSSSTTPSSGYPQLEPLNPYLHGTSTRVRDLKQYVTMDAPCHSEDWTSIQTFYGVDTTMFPSTQLFTKSEAAASVNWVTKSIAETMLDFNYTRKLDLVRCGLTIFVKKDRPGVTCKHALLQQTINIVHPGLTKRKVEVNQQDMIVLLEHGVTATKVTLDELNEDVKLILDQMERGSMCFVLKGSNVKMAIVGWRATSDIGIVVNKKECNFLLEKLKQ